MLSFADMVVFFCFLEFCSPASWKTLHFVSRTIRRDIVYMQTHPAIPPMVQRNPIVACIAFNGGAIICEALRATCRKTFWQVHPVYSYIAWTLNDLHDRLLHLHNIPGFYDLLHMHGRLLVETMDRITDNPLANNPHLTETLEQSARVFGFAPRAMRRYPGPALPVFMFY